MKYKTYLKTRDPVYLQEIHNILSTKSSLTNNDDLNEIQISNMQHNVIGNNSKNLTMSSIDPKNFDHAVRNEIQTLLPYESFQYEDFVILQKACFRYELLNYHNNSLLFQTIYAPEKKYLTNEFLQNITNSKYRESKNYDKTQHCSPLTSLDSIDELFDKYLPTKVEIVSLMKRDLENFTSDISVHMFIQYLSSLCMTQDYIDYDIW